MLLPEAKNDNLARVLNGQRSKQQGIDQAENRGVRADAQRERQDSNRRKSGVLDKHSSGKPNFLPERLHCRLLTRAFGYTYSVCARGAAGTWSTFDFGGASWLRRGLLGFLRRCGRRRGGWCARRNWRSAGRA